MEQDDATDRAVHVLHVWISVNRDMQASGAGGEPMTKI